MSEQKEGGVGEETRNVELDVWANFQDATIRAVLSED
jgi:hypothetical protein